MQKKTVFLMDIGNSTSTFVAYGAHFSSSESIETSLLDSAFLEARFLNSRLVISSVVPQKDLLFEGYDALFVNQNRVSPLSLNVEFPEQVGADRLVNALAAYHQYKGPVFIIDSGTAITGCFVDESGCYQGGLIFPGMRLCSQALNDYTAKLPLIYVSKQDALFGKNTEEAVKIALYRGFISMINGLIADFRAQYPGLTVVGTGTGLEVVLDKIDVDVFDDALIFKGLTHIAKQEGLV